MCLVRYWDDWIYRPQNANDVKIIKMLVEGDVKQKQKAEQALISMPWERRAHILNWAAGRAFSNEDIPTSDHYSERANALYCAYGTPCQHDNTLIRMAFSAKGAGDHERARRLMEERVDLARRYARHEPPQGDENWPTAASPIYPLIYLSEYLLRYFNEIPQAQQYLEESLALARHFEREQGIGDALFFLAVAARKAGDFGAAQAYHKQSFPLRQDGMGDSQLEHLDEMTLLAFEQGQMERAVCLFGFLETQCKTRDKYWLGELKVFHDRETFPRMVDRAWKVLGAQTFIVALWRGRDMTIEQSIEYALDMSPDAMS